MQKIINIDEIIIGKNISLDEYETSFRNMRTSFSYIKNFIYGKYLQYENTKDAFIANVIGKNYMEKYKDDALLILCQTQKDGETSLCVIDSAMLERNDSFVKIHGLNPAKFQSDILKIENLLLFYKTSSLRPIRFLVFGNSEAFSQVMEKNDAIEMDISFFHSFLGSPILSPSSKNSHFISLLGIFLVPVFFVVFLGNYFTDSASKNIQLKAEEIAKERVKYESEVFELKQNPYILNEKLYGNIERKEIAK